MAQAEPVSSDDPAQLDSDALVAFILERYHQVHRAELPALITLARKVEQVHGDHAECPAGLTRFLEKIDDALDEHMRKEEEILFPLMLSNPTHPMIRMPISVMRAEHEEHLATLRELFRITGRLALPEDACGTWRRLYQGLWKFTDDLGAHIETENEQLFPRFSR